MPKAVILLSGGLDSTTAGAVARREGNELYALTMDYGQRHQVEIEAARRVAAWLGVREHIVFPIDLRLFGGSSLTAEWEVCKDVPLEKIGTDIPTSYVPARNTIFLSLALAYAETVGAAKIYIGVSQIDYSGYPDCRQEFITAFTHLANLATGAGVTGTMRFRVEAPLIALSKKEIIQLGLSLGIDYSMTHTCYDPAPSGTACKRCESCLLRLRAFAELGLTDPMKEGIIISETY